MTVQCMRNQPFFRCLPRLAGSLLLAALVSLTLSACACKQDDYPHVQVRGQYDIAIGGTHSN